MPLYAADAMLFAAALRHASHARYALFIAAADATPFAAPCRFSYAAG